MSYYLNNIPIEELGLTLDNGGGGPSLDGVSRDRNVTAMPGFAGVIPSRTANTKARVIRFVFTANRLATAAARAYVLNSLSDSLAGLIEVRQDDGTDRKLLGACTVYEARAYSSPTFHVLTPLITVEVQCFNAAFMDCEPSVRKIYAAQSRMPVGTLPNGGFIYVVGAVSAVPIWIRYRDIAGNVRGELLFTPASLAADERLVIDLDNETWLKYGTTAGVPPTDVSAWNTGSTFFKLRPRDCNRALGIWPTLDTNLSNGAVIYYRRNWEN